MYMYIYIRLSSKYVATSSSTFSSVSIIWYIYGICYGILWYIYGTYYYFMVYHMYIYHIFYNTFIKYYMVYIYGMHHFKAK